MNNNIGNKQVTLWGAAISPYVRKVMVALSEKDISYTHYEILPKVLLNATGQEVPEAFDLASPLGRIPALQVGEEKIADSAVIAGYLDKKFTTGTRLYPQIAQHFAESLWFEHYADTILTSVCYQKIFFEGVVKPKVLHINPDLKSISQVIANELPPLLNYLNNCLSNKTYFAGDEFSMADIAVITQLLALEMYGVEIKDDYKHLKNHFARIISRPSFSSILS